MTLFQNRKWPEIPEAESSDVKEVFAFFGLCSYYCQILEQGLVNLTVALKIRRLTHLTNQDIDEMFDKSNKRTLGQLIKEVSACIKTPDKLEESLASALFDRNYIAHKFFVVHDIDFASENGRIKMINELRQITFRLQLVDRELEAITLPLWERFGLTEEIVEKEFEKMEAEARQMDLN